MPEIRTILLPDLHARVVGDSRRVLDYWEVAKVYYSDILARPGRVTPDKSAMTWWVDAAGPREGTPESLERARLKLQETHQRVDLVLARLEEIRGRGDRGGYYRCSESEYEQIKELFPPAPGAQVPARSERLLPADDLDSKLGILGELKASLAPDTLEQDQVVGTEGGPMILGWGMVSLQPLEVVVPEPAMAVTPPLVPECPQTDEFGTTPIVVPPGEDEDEEKAVVVAGPEKRKSRWWLWLLPLVLLALLLLLLSWLWPLFGRNGLPYGDHEASFGIEWLHECPYQVDNEEEGVITTETGKGKFDPKVITSLRFAEHGPDVFGTESLVGIAPRNSGDDEYTSDLLVKYKWIKDQGYATTRTIVSTDGEPAGEICEAESELLFAFNPVGVLGLREGFRIESSLLRGSVLEQRRYRWEIRPADVYTRQGVEGQTARIDLFWPSERKITVKGHLQGRLSRFTIRPGTGNTIYNVRSNGCEAYYWIGAELEKPTLPHGLRMTIVEPRPPPEGWRLVGKPITVSDGSEERYFYVYQMPFSSLADGQREHVEILLKNDLDQQVKWWLRRGVRHGGEGVEP